MEFQRLVVSMEEWQLWLEKLIMQGKELFPEEWESIKVNFNLELVARYYQFLETYNEKGGFFSNKDSFDIGRRHLLESMFYANYLKRQNYFKEGIQACDVGTGPGLPGFLLVCLLVYNSKIYLLDSSQRKLKFLEEWLETTKKSKGFQESIPPQLLNVNFLYNRAEELKMVFQLVTMRAVVPYPYSVEVVCRIVDRGGYFIPFLAKSKVNEKLEDQILSELGFILEKEDEFQSLSSLGERRVKVLKKMKEPKKNYPRDWKKIHLDIKGGKWEKLLL